MFESLIACLINLPLFFILTVISLAGLLSGIFLMLRPVSAIEIQKKFYAKINWKIEPISMPKEIRNTRLMGVSLVVFSVTTLIFAFLNRPLFKI